MGRQAPHCFRTAHMGNVSTRHHHGGADGCDEEVLSTAIKASQDYLGAPPLM